MSPNNIAYWLPRLNISQVSSPRTFLVNSVFEPLCLSDTKNPVSQEHIDDLTNQIDFAVQQLGGYPVFMRCGGSSAKHYWKDTCYLTSKDQIINNLYQITEYCEMGNVGEDCKTIAIRELIPTEKKFTAFPGDMPITREYRLFMTNVITAYEGMLGFPKTEWRLTHMQAYWPAEAFTKYGEPGWEPLLEAMNAITPEEVDELTNLCKKAMSGFYGHSVKEWSIDALQDVNGKWWIIDMATGSTSHRHEAIPGFVPEAAEDVPKPEKQKVEA